VRRSIRRLAAAGVLSLVGVPVALATAGPAAAQQTDPVTFVAILDDQDLSLSSTGDPIVLDPDEESILTLTMRNTTNGPVTVRNVQLSAGAFGVTLLAYNVTINADIAAQDETRVEVPVDFVELGEQASGLLPASMRLLDENRDLLGKQNFTLDVQGSATSLTTIFTLVVAIATIAALVVIWIAIARRRLPHSRWRRGLRFALVGAGAGVSATLVLAELLLVTPAGKVWIPLLVVPAGAAFLLGWFSPGPLADDDEEEVIEDWMRETVMDPGAPRDPS
jgi:hypothetical protein